ncbi:MAG: hypothetical protein HUK21_03585 [Fibrobacteraceae bacterium]|nr:hypothetical protein [Fibrobacteraceae bacterium]
MHRLLPLLIALALLGCDSEGPVAKIIVIDKKMPLIDWPDSTYIASLDSILALEPVKKNDTTKTNIKMNAFKAPTFALPTSVTGKASKSSGKGLKNSSSPTAGATAKNTGASENAEAFMNKFAKGLERLQSDPTNSSLYKVVEVKDGEDLFKLLRRTYGGATQNLPRFYVSAALQSVNPGVLLDKLSPGDKVRVPKL